MGIVKSKDELVVLTRPLPPRHPARFGVNHRDDPVEVRRRADLNTVWRALHLFGLPSERGHATATQSAVAFGEIVTMGRTCMISSQFGHPSRRKSEGVCITEQSRHARSCL